MKQLATGLTPFPHSRVSLKRDVLLIAYAISSFVYRMFVVAAILFFVHHLASMHSLRVAAWLLTFIMLAAIAAKATKTLAIFKLSTTERRWVGAGRRLAACSFVSPSSSLHC
ncbi:MAG: hypothetical protein R3C05_19475 [Pirellulaceae bacterium]